MNKIDCDHTPPPPKKNSNNNNNNVDNKTVTMAIIQKKIFCSYLHVKKKSLIIKTLKFSSLQWTNC